MSVDSDVVSAVFACYTGSGRGGLGSKVSVDSPHFVLMPNGCTGCKTLKL